jgi:hypothetical protein
MCCTDAFHGARRCCVRDCARPNRAVGDAARRSATLFLVLLWGLLPSSGDARADRVLFDFESAYLYQPGYTVKDHDLLSDGALWHAFYIRGIEGTPGTSSETQLGHATSADLRNWIVLDPILDAGPEEWDTRRVWAPDIRPEGNEWSMYYTGVSTDLLQRMGAATSSNLKDWSKIPGNPVVEPDSTVYLWSPDLPVPELSAFRDPFQFEYMGETHLLHTALIPDSTVTAGRRGVIHHLVDDGNGAWTDVGPLAANNNTAIGEWRELESVQLIQAQSRWHLLFTYFGVAGIYWVGSDTMDSGWDISSAQLIDPGVGAEITPSGNGTWILTRHGAAAHAPPHPMAGANFFVLRTDSIRFDPGTLPPTVIRENSFAQRWPEQQGLAFVAAPTFGDNFLERGLDPVGLIGNGYLSSIDLYDGPFGQYGAPGADVGLTATGAIYSKWFTIAPDDSVMTMLIAGPEDPLCTIRLVERLSADGEPLQVAALDSTRANGVIRFSYRAWDIRAWRGKTVRLEVEDFSATGWIALDHVRTLSSNPVHTSTPATRPATVARFMPNRPNPFNPRTELRWVLTKDADCRLEIFDLRGRRQIRIEAGHRNAGENALVFDAEGLASGIYLVRLIADGRPEAHLKISLVR